MFLFVQLTYNTWLPTAIFLSPAKNWPYLHMHFSTVLPYHTLLSLSLIFPLILQLLKYLFSFQLAKLIILSFSFFTQTCEPQWSYIIHTTNPLELNYLSVKLKLIKQSHHDQTDNIYIYIYTNDQQQPPSVRRPCRIISKLIIEHLKVELIRWIFNEK